MFHLRLKSINGNGIAMPGHGQLRYCNKSVLVNPGETCDILAFWDSGGTGPTR
jgi:hypothetical protein